MAGTGVPKFGGKKIIGYFIGGVVILIAALLASYYITAIFGEFIAYPKRGEKTRFMRYMTCALAICIAPNPAEGSACNSDMVMGWTVEYDESGNSKIGCQHVCREMENRAKANGLPVPLINYCSKDYALNFTFREEVKYVGNHSAEKLKPGECGPKSGLQTDVSCSMPWRDYMVCSCLKCPGTFGPEYPEGRLVLKSGGCGYGPGPYGTIYVDEDLETSGKIDCEPGYVGIGGGQAWCNFYEGTEIYIWAENIEGAVFNYCHTFWDAIVTIFTLGYQREACGPGVIPHDCQKVVICENI